MLPLDTHETFPQFGFRVLLGDTGLGSDRFLNLSTVSVPVSDPPDDTAFTFVFDY
jgi:hypothetical protein